MITGLPFEDKDICDWMQTVCVNCKNDVNEDCFILADIFAGEWPVQITREGSFVICSSFEQTD